MTEDSRPDPAALPDREDSHIPDRRLTPDRRSSWRRATDLYRRDNAYVLLRDLDNILQRLKEEIIDRDEGSFGGDLYAEGMLACRTQVAEAVEQYRRSAS